VSWEQRLRDLVLAGGAAGALAAVGCVGGSVAGGDAGSDGDVGPDVNFEFCCNADVDPCCPSLYCGAPVTMLCAEKTACKADGGTWDDDTEGCSSLEDSGATDASHEASTDAPPEAATSPDAATDASPDATYPDVPFCCNANADPCCPSLYCGALVTVQCTEKMVCEADGGTWEYGGAEHCVEDAPPGDAASDASANGHADGSADAHGQPD
jgi:hypothetical protein